MCCSVLQSVAVSWSVLQCVCGIGFIVEAGQFLKVASRVLSVAVCCSVVQCGAVWFVLQCAAVGCSVL